MILTVKENYDKYDGTDLPMYSRSGKSTTSQYLQFEQHGHRKPSLLGTIDSDEGDEAGMQMNSGQTSKNNIAQEIVKIIEYKKMLK